MTDVITSPPETYILSRTSKALTASQYTKRWAAFWRKHSMAHPVVRFHRRKRNGKEYTYRATEWVANICAHQFRHGYVCMLCMSNVPEEIAIKLVGHANTTMIREVYLTLKPQMIIDAGNKLNTFLYKNVDQCNSD
jgi:integrase